MSYIFSYETLLRCISGLVCTAVVSVVIVETDVLPAEMRRPLRGAIHQATDRATQSPAVREILRTFY